MPEGPTKTHSNSHGSPTASGLVPAQPSLQSLIGNQAVLRIVNRPGGAAAISSLVSRKKAEAPGPVVDLLTDKAAFKKATDAGLLAGRGKTLREIERLLDEYHAIAGDGKHLVPGADQDRAITILMHIRQDVNLWIESHEGDKSRSRHRTAGMTDLFIASGKILAQLNKIREAAATKSGGTATPITGDGNTFKTQMEGPVTSVFAKLGPIISTTAPSEGDSAKLEIELKVPIEPSGVGYLGFRFKVSAERQEKQAMKLGLEVAFIGGAKIPKTVDVGGELGMYIESRGATPEKALELLSYGMYRRLRESRVIPNEMANFIWGGSATSVGWKRAEKWAAKVEKENFKAEGTDGGDDDGSYVETGMLAGAKAKGGVGGVAELEGSIGYKTGKKYDYGSVSKLKKGGVGAESSLPTMRGQVEVIGESTHRLEFSISASGGPFSGGLTVGLTWATENRTGRARLQELTIGFEAAASLPMHKLVAEGVGGFIVPLIPTVIAAVKRAIEAASNKKKTTSQDVGMMLGMGENVATAFTQLGQVPSEAFKVDFSLGDPDAFEASASLKLALGGGWDFTKDPGKQGNFEVSLTYEKGIAVNADVFAMKVTKGQRLFTKAYKDGKWGPAK